MITRKIVASIILVYNLIGLIALFGLSPNDPFYWDDNTSLFLFTFPITIISFGIRYAESNSSLLVAIVQLIILAITLYIGDVITRSIITFFKKR